MFRTILATAITLFLLAWLLPTVEYADWFSLLLASIVLAFINTIIKPVLKLITFPINMVTMGLFSVVLNVALLWFLTYLVPGFSIQSMVVLGVPLNAFFSFLLISVLISLIYRVIRFFLH